MVAADQGMQYWKNKERNCFRKCSFRKSMWLSHELLTFYSLLRYPLLTSTLQGVVLNPKGLPHGTPYHPLGTPWRVQESLLGPSLLCWQKKESLMSGSGLCQRASSPLRDLCRGCRYAYVGTGTNFFVSTGVSQCGPLSPSKFQD